MNEAFAACCGEFGPTATDHTVFDSTKPSPVTHCKRFCKHNTLLFKSSAETSRGGVHAPSTFHLVHHSPSQREQIAVHRLESSESRLRIINRRCMYDYNSSFHCGKELG